MKHTVAIDVIIGYLFNEPTTSQQFEEATRHLTTCSSCLVQLDAALGLFEGHPYGLGTFLADSSQPSPRTISFKEYIREREITNNRLWLTVQKTQLLLHTINILLTKKGAQLGELATELQPFKLAPIPIRGELQKQPEGLSLIDQDLDVCINLRLARHGLLFIQISAISSGEPLSGLISLMTSGEPKRILQRITLKPGDEGSLPLSQGDLIVHIEHDSNAWSIPIKITLGIIEENGFIT